MSKRNLSQLTALTLVACGLVISATAKAQYRQKIANDMVHCSAGAGPAVKVTVTGIKAGGGTLRVQTYNGTKADWLKKGRWLSRIESDARAGSMTFCIPVPSSGNYAVAVRHDVNGNKDTDLFEDGGAMSNNPRISIWNLGKPSYLKTAFAVGHEAKSIDVKMRYW